MDTGPRSNRELKARGLNVDFVGSVSIDPPSTLEYPGADPDHEGWGGFTTADIDAHVTQWVQSAAPDVVLVSIGTNDLVGPNDPSAALISLVNKVKLANPNAFVLVSGLPANPGFSPANFAAFTQTARNLGNASATDRVVFVDLGAEMAAAGWNWKFDTPDQTHPTLEGGVFYANAWLPSVLDCAAVGHLLTLEVQ